MDIKIKNQQHNKLLHRNEIEAVVQAEVTPSGSEIKKAIAEKLKTSEDLVIVKRIHPSFGEHKRKINAFIYENAEAGKIEPKKKAKKGAAPAPAAA